MAFWGGRVGLMDTPFVFLVIYFVRSLVGDQGRKG